MATWTTIPDTVLEPGKPARSVDAIALRDNPIAIAEGAAGAPAVASAALADYPWGAEDFQTGTAERDWVLARTAAAGAAAVGTYVFAQGSGTLQTLGGTKSGSELIPDNASGTANRVSLSGTWRAMGDMTTGNDESLTTLWLRIS